MTHLTKNIRTSKKRRECACSFSGEWTTSALPNWCSCMFIISANSKPINGDSSHKSRINFLLREWTETLRLKIAQINRFLTIKSITSSLKMYYIIKKPFSERKQRWLISGRDNAQCICLCSVHISQPFRPVDHDLCNLFGLRAIFSPLSRSQ